MVWELIPTAKAGASFGPVLACLRWVWVKVFNHENRIFFGSSVHLPGQDSILGARCPMADCQAHALRAATLPNPQPGTRGLGTQRSGGRTKGKPEGANKVCRNHFGNLPKRRLFKQKFQQVGG